MTSDSKSLSDVMNENNLKDYSLPSNFQLGKELFESGNVEIRKYYLRRVFAIVHSDTKRKVEFVLNEGLLDWKCTCRLNQTLYCKHAVAVGLEILSRK